MIEPRCRHTGHRAEGDERRRKLGDARLQREHPAVDARQRAAQAAVIGIEYGGGFRHADYLASTQWDERLLNCGDADIDAGNLVSRKI